MCTRLAICVLAGLLAGQIGCGGGGSSAQPVAAPPAQSSPPAQFTPGMFEASANFKDLCLAPRAGAQFPDVQGTTTDENNWLRSWSNELYLWYDEIEDQNPANYPTAQYFDLMKTTASTASGAPKDQFHFTIPTDEWEALSQSGLATGYGTRFSVTAPLPPREILVAYTDASGPAAAAGLARGAQIIQVDGVSVVNGTDVDTLNAGLFPLADGEDHVFVIQDSGATASRTITLRSEIVTDDPVRNLEVFATPTGPVGYLLFTQHIAPSEQELIDAVEVFAAAGITDLILDIRYNSGGFLDIANELAYMIAGGSAAAGRVFSELQFNDKHTAFNPVTGAALAPDFFHTTTQGFSTAPGNVLPTLAVNRMFVLTGVDTCSASEAIINGLIGIDFEVIQIGVATCGKPYGFFVFDNCGTSYFSIQFRGINAKGFGDYADGFSPGSPSQVGPATPAGCAVSDDFENSLGDPGEAQLAAALNYRTGLGCPVSTTSVLTSNQTRLQKASTARAITRPAVPGAVKDR